MANDYSKIKQLLSYGRKPPVPQPTAQRQLLGPEKLSLKKRLFGSPEAGQQKFPLQRPLFTSVPEYHELTAPYSSGPVLSQTRYSTWDEYREFLEKTHKPDAVSADLQRRYHEFKPKGAEAPDLFFDGQAIAAERSRFTHLRNDSGGAWWGSQAGVDLVNSLPRSTRNVIPYLESISPAFRHAYIARDVHANAYVDLVRLRTPVRNQGSRIHLHEGLTLVTDPGMRMFTAYEARAIAHRFGMNPRDVPADAIIGSTLAHEVGHDMHAAVAGKTAKQWDKEADELEATLKKSDYPTQDYRRSARERIADDVGFETLAQNHDAVFGVEYGPVIKTPDGEGSYKKNPTDSEFLSMLGDSTIVDENDRIRFTEVADEVGRPIVSKEYSYVQGQQAISDVRENRFRTDRVTQRELKYTDAYARSAEHVVSSLRGSRWYTGEIAIPRTEDLLSDLWIGHNSLLRLSMYDIAGLGPNSTTMGLLGSSSYEGWVPDALVAHTRFFPTQSSTEFGEIFNVSSAVFSREGTLSGWGAAEVITPHVNSGGDQYVFSVGASFKGPTGRQKVHGDFTLRVRPAVRRQATAEAATFRYHSRNGRRMLRIRLEDPLANDGLEVDESHPAYNKVAEYGELRVDMDSQFGFRRASFARETTQGRGTTSYTSIDALEPRQRAAFDLAVGYIKQVLSGTPTSSVTVPVVPDSDVVGSYATGELSVPKMDANGWKPPVVKEVKSPVVKQAPRKAGELPGKSPPKPPKSGARPSRTMRHAAAHGHVVRSGALRAFANIMRRLG